MTNSTISFRKSSYSASGQACVMVGQTLAAMRDSKQPAGPILAAPNLGAFVAAIKSGQLAPTA